MAEGVRVLIVDDEFSVTVTMQAILEQEGYAVSTALTGHEARALIATTHFDVALMDLRIDDADGIELLAELQGRQPDCSAIMLTGYASLDSAVRAIRLGAYDYLTKPCDLDELKLTIARALERGALIRQLRVQLAELEEANARIRSFADELQQRIDEATAELNRKVEELSATKRGLERAQRQREEFISMVVHELGQPLTNISGYAQLLERRSISPAVEERAKATIASETRRLTRLVQDLADVARLAAGRFHVDPIECDLVELAREQVEMARARAEHHALSLEAEEWALPALCDRDRVAQVLSNLLTNALKYTPGGQIHVRLFHDDGQSCVSVSDEGPGIPADRLDEIFDPHVRLMDDGGNGAARGSGLGLYVAKGIAEAHGGRIWAESAEGQGTTLTLCLPAAEG